MLEISPEQAQALAEAVKKAFVERICVYLTQQHGGAVEGLAPLEIEQRVVLGLERATSHGMTAESALAAFVVLTFEIGLAFDEQPDIRRILADPLIAPDSRMDALALLAPTHAWEEAATAARRNSA
jgi:hypothetical protein